MARLITPAMASPPAGIQGPKGRSDLSMDVAATVVKVSVLETAEPDGVTLAGAKEQTARLGKAPQEKFTVPE
jgi:hypothetical protein